METLSAAMSGSLLAAVYLVYQLPAAGAKIEEGALVYFAMQE